MSRLSLLAVALSALAVGCSSPPPATTVRDVALGQPFTIKVGEAVRAGDRVVRLVSIEDGRCPEGTECVWAGEALVTIEMGGRAVTLTTQDVAREPLAPVELWEVTPYPGSAEAEEGEPIRVTLAVMPAGD